MREVELSYENLGDKVKVYRVIENGKFKFYTVTIDKLTVNVTGFQGLKLMFRRLSRMVSETTYRDLSFVLVDATGLQGDSL